MSAADTFSARLICADNADIQNERNTHSVAKSLNKVDVFRIIKKGLF